ncbi:MAG: sigma 54-interacting transcriptional regulator [Candidatus Acidiferrales bacterium]
MAEAGVARSAYAPRNEQLPPERIIFGRSAAMLAIRQKIERIALTGVPVLIQGDSGTGKGVLARYIHERSGAAPRPFIKVNCAAIPGSLLESELFGYEKGAFTGAYATKPGRAEQAEGGTLFLDGIDEIDRSLQAKLLQLLQDGQFSRIGGQEDRHVNVRALCATHRALEREIEAGRFRQDLFYRINVVNLHLPPLRSRREDILDLAHYFLELHQRRHNTLARAFSGTMLQLLARHPWPGNIRELENLVERYVILGSEDAVTTELLHWEQTHLSSELPTDGPIHLKKITRQAVRDLEKKIILRVLEANRWNRKRAAVELKISYRALLYKIRQAGLPPKRSLRHKEEPGLDSAVDARNRAL